MAETQVKDETGTVPPMSRSEIEAKMFAEVNASAAPILEGIKDEEQRKKAEEAVKKIQAFAAMATMWLNAVIADMAATTVYTFEQTYGFKDYLAYQAGFNNEVAKRLDAITATVRDLDVTLIREQVTRLEQKAGMLIQELKKLQPDHTIPPEKRAPRKF